MHPMSVTTEKAGRLSYLQGQWKSLWESKPNRDFSDDEAKSLRDWNTEMKALGEDLKALSELDDMAKMHVTSDSRPVVNDSADPVTPLNVDVSVKSIRDTILASADYKAFREGRTRTAEIQFDTDLKTLISLSTVTPAVPRLPRIEPYPVERRIVSDLMMQGTMAGNVLEYYEETTFTNAAVEVAEGIAKPEAALDWTLVQETASKIAVWIPATSESLADIAWLESTIRARLLFMLERREEAQLLNGNGTAPNISGITDRSGIQTQAKGGDPTFDAILRAMTLVQVNSFYDPDAVVFHPNDWRDLLLTRTADGLYILGNPGDPLAARRLWGLEVRSTTAQTENTAIVGAFGTASQIFRRSGPTITVSTEHASYFIENKVAIMAEERLGLAVYRPSAFCTVTGI